MSDTTEDNTRSQMMIVEMLPELTEEWIRDATQNEHLEWARGMLEFYEPGAIHEIEEWGITLQIVSSDTARCISVFDHGYPMHMLQMLITTFEAAGLTLEIAPYTVLRPYVAPEKEEDDGAEDPQNSVRQAYAMEVV
ncbi:MAG: hypothetical protein CL512_06200 [Actinobacteria bacterium]|nr:hypothetical protein [Actinomycetota bacterium]